MLAAPHAASGIFIARRTRSRTRAALLAVCTHFLLDRIPHWQETLPPYVPGRASTIRLPLDLLLAVLLVEWAARGHPTRAGTIRVCAALAVLPDVDALAFAFPALAPPRSRRRRYVEWHNGLQRETSSLWGILPQLAVLALAWSVHTRVRHAWGDGGSAPRRGTACRPGTRAGGRDRWAARMGRRAIDRPGGSDSSRGGAPRMPDPSSLTLCSRR